MCITIVDDMIIIGDSNTNRTVKLIHTPNQRKLQQTGSEVGMALSAL